MLHIQSVSSLEKVFPDAPIDASAPAGQGFLNEVISWQIVLTADELHNVQAHTECPCITLQQVRTVPVHLPVYPDTDDNYLRKTPGLYPDLLCPLPPHGVRVRPGQPAVLWVTFDPNGTLPAGDHEISIHLQSETEQHTCAHTVTLLPASLPGQKLIHTKWFYADCLADYYHVPVFSEEHWRIIENFLRTAVEGGINMILMPVHTPPLDTRVGGERTTTQLAGIRMENGTYHFDMTNVRRWIALCKKLGVEYYEVAHLFTQWGAQHAPKIVADVNGVPTRIFGWDTDAAGEEYGAFLRQYIPALREVFREEGIAERVWWHISDEPSQEHLPSYLAAKKQVEDVLKGERIMDALSSFDFYQQGVVEHPVVASNHMLPFLDANVPDLWMYYCCGQHVGVSNLFIAMPSARTRMLGAQLFRYRLQGFLQWGFNFYNSQYSDYPIDPYFTTDGDGWVPGGDTFQVYPAPDGTAWPSIRYMVCREAMQDLRALELLESLAGFDAANALLGDITLTHYPVTSDAMLALRQRINDAIVSHL